MFRAREGGEDASESAVVKMHAAGGGRAVACDGWPPERPVLLTRQLGSRLLGLRLFGLRGALAGRVACEEPLEWWRRCGPRPGKFLAEACNLGSHRAYRSQHRVAWRPTLELGQYPVRLRLDLPQTRVDEVPGVRNPLEWTPRLQEAVGDRLGAEQAGAAVAKLVLDRGVEFGREQFQRLFDAVVGAERRDRSGRRRLLGDRFIGRASTRACGDGNENENEEGASAHYRFRNVAIHMPARAAAGAVVRLTSGACSHLGLRRRRNEDALLDAPEHGVFAVADGMGGHPAGDVASRIAIGTLREQMLEGAAASPEDRLERAFAAANDALLAHALTRPDHSGLGTTMTALLIVQRQAVVGHVGDSRLYRLRDGVLQQLTTDHTWVEREVAHGRLTRVAARNHPHSAVLLRVLGGADAAIDRLELELRSGDRLLLCTDGVSNAVQPADLSAIVRQGGAPGDIARHLCEAADAAGGFDNSTAVVIDIT